MYAGGAPKPGRVCGGDRQSCARAGEIRAGYDLPRHAGQRGTRDHVRAILGEACVSQVRADIDQFHVHVSLPRVYLSTVYLYYRLRFRALVLLSLCFAGLQAGAQQGGDLQAQILYAFHSEETNQLASLIQTLNTQVQAGGADSALRYHLAHAEYRLGLLTGEKRAPSAESA